MNILQQHWWYKCLKNTNAKDVELNLKPKTGEKENTAQNDVRDCMLKADNLKKDINGLKKLKNKGFNQSRQIQVVGCLEKSTMNKQKNKCQKVAKSHITTLTVDTMEKLKQKNVRFAQNLKKGYSSIIRMGIGKTMKFKTLLQSAISVTHQFMHHSEIKQGLIGKI